MSETVLLIICAQSILCFFVGAKIGQMVRKGENIKISSPNPIKIIQDYKSSKESEEEARKLNLMFENIDNYDGTSLGQKDIE